MHNWCNGVNFASNLSFAFSLKKILVERNIIDNPYKKIFKLSNYEIHKGKSHFKETPGLGVEMIELSRDFKVYEKKFKVLAVISARGGSKGIPKKNLKRLANKPLIFHTIDTILKIKEIDKIVLSSDDEKILKTCKKYSKKIELIKRPKRLAMDKTPLTSVVKYVAIEQEKIGYRPDFVLQISPTCPLIKVKTIKKIITHLIKKSNCVVTLKRIEHDHPYRAKKL